MNHLPVVRIGMILQMKELYKMNKGEIERFTTFIRSCDTTNWSYRNWAESAEAFLDNDDLEYWAKEDELSDNQLLANSQYEY